MDLDWIGVFRRIGWIGFSVDLDWIFNFQKVDWIDTVGFFQELDLFLFLM